MVRKKQKQSEEKRTRKKNVKEYTMEVSQTRSDIKTFIDKFKSDVDKKKKNIQSYARKLRKKKF